MISSQQKKYENVELENMLKSITKEEVEKYLKSKEIDFINLELVNDNEEFNKFVFQVEDDPILFTTLQALNKEDFPEHDQKIHIKFIISTPTLDLSYRPKEDEEIKYPYEYNKVIKVDFIRAIGSDSLVFGNNEIIAKQRAVMGYLIKHMGYNLLSGKSIMNVSLPINIFDVRSHLEVFVYQTCYADDFLKLAAKAESPIESLKYTTTFVLTTVHLAVAQLKPFNPILGETFQAKINDCHFYVEQTSHHPPIFNFLYMGNGYKVYGYNQSEVSSGTNSMTAKYKGSYTVEFSNGITQKVFFPQFTLSGMLMGNRTIKYKGNLIVIDEQNDLIAHIDMDPDDRGFFKKMLYKKKNFPDYFSGIITNISSNCKLDKKDKTYYPVDLKKNVLSEIEGEWTSHIKFGEKTYWDYEKLSCPVFRRMCYTLPSDSTFREDSNWLRLGNEDMAQKAKIKLEEIQRTDKKLRQANLKQMKKEK